MLADLVGIDTVKKLCFISSCLSLSNRCGGSRISSENFSVARSVTHSHNIMARVPLHVLFLPHFDVIHDLLLNRSKGTWILFVNEISGLKTGNIKTHLVVPRVPSIYLEIR